MYIYVNEAVFMYVPLNRSCVDVWRVGEGAKTNFAPNAAACYIRCTHTGSYVSASVPLSRSPAAQSRKGRVPSWNEPPPFVAPTAATVAPTVLSESVSAPQIPGGICIYIYVRGFVTLWVGSTRSCLCLSFALLMLVTMIDRNNNAFLMTIVNVCGTCMMQVASTYLPHLLLLALGVLVAQMFGEAWNNQDKLRVRHDTQRRRERQRERGKERERRGRH